jgi:hypothetical protein
MPGIIAGMNFTDRGKRHGVFPKPIIPIFQNSAVPDEAKPLTDTSIKARTQLVSCGWWVLA